MPTEHIVKITDLRDSLGIAYLHVARTGEPVIVERYRKQQVILVPLWEWRMLKEMEEADAIASRNSPEVIS